MYSTMTHAAVNTPKNTVSTLHSHHCLHFNGHFTGLRGLASSLGFLPPLVNTWYRFFTGCVPFLTPNQDCQSSEETQSLTSIAGNYPLASSVLHPLPHSSEKGSCSLYLGSPNASTPAQCTHTVTLKQKQLIYPKMDV